MIDVKKMRELAADLIKGSVGRYKWYAMNSEETSYFMEFHWGHEADRWLAYQQKLRETWIEQEGIHIVKKLFQTELETDASTAANAIFALLDRLEAAKKALLQIAEIQNKTTGGDWDEIEEARQLAKAALEQGGIGDV